MRDFIKEIINDLIWEDLRRGLIDLRPERWDVRLMAAIGLLATLAMLLAVLSFSHGLLAGNPVVLKFSNAPDTTYSIPFVALMLAMLGFAVGWALLLAGGARCRFWVFLLIGALFVVQALVLGNAVAGSDLSLLAFTCLLSLEVVLALGSYFALRYLRRKWTWVGIPEIAWWLGLVSAFVALIWIGGESNSAIATYFAISISVVLILATFYWFYLAIDIAEVGVKVGRLVVNGARQLLSPQLARWLILVFLLFKPFFSFGLFGLTESLSLALDIFASLAPIVIAVVLLLVRRYSATAAYVLLSLSLTLSVMGVSLALAQGGSDFSSFILERTKLVSPIVIFVTLTIWDIASSGARFANNDGKILPRAGRIPLYAGALTLATTTTMFYTAAHNPLLQEMADNALLLGLAILGIPYILFVTWRRREMMIGSPLREEEGLALFRRMPRKAWAAVVALAIVIACCGCFSLWTIWMARASR